jgi:hypothetical protein
MNMNLSQIVAIQEATQDVILVPAESFFCPYWMINTGGFLLFMAGIIIGVGSVYGWKKLFFRILILMNQR